MAQPTHVGIIVDGNRRWARQHNLPTLEGHRRGYARVKEVGRWLIDRGVPWATFYLFSTENWNRAHEEVGYLMRLLEEGLERDVEGFVRDGIRLRFVGSRTRLSPRLQELMARAEEVTSAGARGSMVAAINYGGQQDIVEGVQALARTGVDCSTLTAEQLKSSLSTATLPPADLIIRTSGEQRLSNFLLWESAYAELYFAPMHFPDFSESDLDTALEWYASRERRHGK
ncbi:di-trans,poly-cis-decaprenylcistransferase [Candidatus Uhrbacteria bacterium]|nr:di-trans,poly-cis-decaprenylcistransferase [Candidatus Uhrbacteria bacterium]